MRIFGFEAGKLEGFGTCTCVPDLKKGKIRLMIADGRFPMATRG
jgi:hypothetical protein